MTAIRHGRRWVPLLLSACAVVAAVSPVAAQGEDTSGWRVTWPSQIVPGQLANVSGTTDARCKPGTAEVGFDPAFNTNAPLLATDGRSGQQSSVTVPVGQFTTTLAIPDWATDGWLYAFCSIGMDGRREVFMQATTPAPLTGTAEPVDGSGSWGGLVFPSSVVPGTTITLQGVAPDTCVPGTIEAGVDPGNWGDPSATDPRSGQQLSTSVPNGAFSVRLDVPSDIASTATRVEGERAVVQIYVLCVSEDEFGGRTTIYESRTVTVAAVDEEQPPTESSAPTADDFRFELRDGDTQLTGTATSPIHDAPSIDLEDGFVLAAGPGHAGAVPPQAVKVPSGAACNVSTCLWGYFTPPYYGCNQNVVIVNFGPSRYGSMTAFGYIRKGTADYITARPLFYQDGRLIKTGDWERKAFFNWIGQPWESWIAVRIHQQFASPQSRYQVAFQARWYRNESWGRDRMLAATGRVSPVPYICVAGP